MCLATLGSLKIDVEPVLIDPLRFFLILICITDFLHSFRVNDTSLHVILLITFVLYLEKVAGVS